MDRYTDDARWDPLYTGPDCKHEVRPVAGAFLADDEQELLAGVDVRSDWRRVEEDTELATEDEERVRGGVDWWRYC